MRRIWFIFAILLLSATGCKPEAPQEEEPSSSEGQSEQEEAAEENQEESTPTPELPTPEFEGIEGGYFISTRFNIRFQFPSDWEVATQEGDDSITIHGPHDLQMIVANTQSIQLVDSNFEQLGDNIAFDQVRLQSDRTEQRMINGMPGYRVEGDARLVEQDVPVYFISQAINLNLPGEPVVATVFIPGDWYSEHSETMKGVLDSIEALDLRPE